MSNDTIPENPVEGGRVFRRLEDDQFAVLATTQEGYRRGEALVKAVDSGLSADVSATLSAEGIDVLGVELLVEGDANGAPFDVGGAVGLTAVWVSSEGDPPVDDSSVYVFARQGATGPEPLGPEGDGSTGSFFVGHYDGERDGVTPDEWCRTVAAPESVAESGPSVLLDGEQFRYTPSETALLVSPDDAWFLFSARLRLEAHGTTLRIRSTDSRYRHFEWLVGTLGLRDDAETGDVPDHLYFGTDARAVPAWSTARSAPAGEFEIQTPDGPVSSPSREKLSTAERRAMGPLDEDTGVGLAHPERMRRLRNLQSPTGTQPGFGGYLESTDANRLRFEEFFDDAIPAGLDITPEDLQILSSDVQRENPDYHELPPRDLWSGMVPTLELLDTLGRESDTTFEVLSAYRSDVVNSLSGGATNSKHMSFAGLDVEPRPRDESTSVDDHQQAFEAYVKHYWLSDEAEDEEFGLGFYRRGRIHVDTLGYRRWPDSWRNEPEAETERRYQRFFGDDDDQ